MKKNTIKIISIILVSLLIVLSLTSNVWATDTNPITNPGYYNPGKGTVASGAEGLKDIGNDIIGVIQIIGTIISVAVLIILGIKYMVGSVEERAEYKKTMLPYLIGAIMLFGITNILAIIASISSNLF